MTLLIIVISVAAPSLGNFFRGRTLDSEARRLLALTRLGQSRAAYEGLPAVLWLNIKARTYGLELEPGYVDLDSKAVEFTLDKELQMQLADDEINRLVNPTLNINLNPNRQIATGANRRGVPEIRFLPDGSIAETSPSVVRLLDRDGLAVWVALSRNRLNYEIRNPTNQLDRAYP